MTKPSPRYEFRFRWGDFHLNIIGRRTILWWLAFACAAVGLKLLGARLLSLL
jgi:hypothetical protein